MDYRQKIEEKRQIMLNTLIQYIESNPTAWESGWYHMPSESPINGKTQKKYKGLNAFYLSVLGAIKGYSDPRWVTFAQAKELGANVKSGEKSSEVFYWSWYDKKTKQPFDEKTVSGMTKEEELKYREENVRPVIKYYQVFNAEQCSNMPEYTKETVTPEMELEERAKQVALIERVIENSAAPVNYNGGNRAFYSPSTDSIHLPEIERFKSMQDIYATALHEIAHSTGHSSRLNREMSGGFGTPNYAREELRAELASVFMQIELGLSLEGKHFENHGAYLASWLKAVKNNQKDFFAAASDAEKIADYVADNYAKERVAEEMTSNEPVFEPNTSFAKQVEAVLSGADTKSTHLKVMGTPLILRQLGAKNLPVLMTAKHLKTIVAESGDDKKANYHNVDVDIIKRLPELLADPVIVMDSLTKADSVVILTSTVDSENRPILGAVKFDGKGYLNSLEINSNILASVYGKDNFNDFIRRNLDAGTILYWNKEKSQELTKIPGVQFPDNLNSLTTNTIIRQAKAFVNSFGVNNSENTKENSNNGQAEQAQPVEQAEQAIYGIIYNWKGLKEENSLYTESQLKELDEAFKPEERYDGAIAANKTYMAFRLTGNSQEETERNIRDFLTGKYNQEEVIPTEGWYWETVDSNLFTGEPNATTAEYIQRLNLSEQDLRMSEEENTKENSNTEQVQQAQQAEQVGQVNERYVIDFRLNYGNEMLLSNELKALGFERDHSIDEINSATELAAWNAKAEYWSEEIRYINKNGAVIDGIVGVTNNGIIVQRGDISRFTISNLGRADVEKIAEILHSFGAEVKITTEEERRQANLSRLEELALQDLSDKEIENTKEKSIKEQAEQAQQVGQAEQAKPTGKWSNIPINASQIGEERGKVTRITMPDGEYSSFVFSLPTKLVRRDEEKGTVQVSVNDNFKYNLRWGYQQVELTGSELCQALAGKVVGKRTQRVLSPENEQTLSDLEHNVPEEMRNYPNWCVYKTRWNEEKGKKDKSIFSPTLGLDSSGKMQWASVDKPETWATFDEAMTFAKENNCAGLVFVLNGNGISCIDLDKAIVKDGMLNGEKTNKPEGTLSSIAEKLTSEMKDTYIETSASGNGLHIFVKDDILSKGRYKNRVELPDGEIEVYDEKRFMSMTGNLRSNTVRLGKSPIATTVWLQAQLGEQVAIKATAKQQPPRRLSGTIDRSDSAVLERIRRSKKAGEFEALFRGENVTGGTHSQNDMKLLNILAFFTDCDPMQMESIFKDSALYRPEKRKYLQHSIDKAIDTLSTRMSDRALMNGNGAKKGNGNNRGK